MRFLLLALGAFYLNACSAAVDDPLAAIVSEEVEAVMEDTGFAAISATIVRLDEIKTYHYGVLASGDLPDDETLYDIGSITKTHTGLILAAAVLDGRIGLDDPVAEYFPEFDAAVFERDGERVTIRHLATHVGGLPTNLACNNPELIAQSLLDCFMEHDQADLLMRLETPDLLDQPGTRYRYSNAGIRLIGVILERAYERPFEALLADIVFARTGQTETQLALNADARQRWQIGEHENGLPAPDASGYFNPAGGMKSTAPDMGRYMRFYLASGDELADETVRLLVGDSAGLGRAYIWNTFQLDSEGQLYHGGGTFGSSAWISIYPRDGLGIFLVTPYVSATAQGDLNGAANRIIARLRELD